MKKWILALLIFVPCTAWGDTTVSYQQGAASYSGCLDTQIKQGAATTNYTSGTTYESTKYTTYDNDRTNILIKFDLSGITGTVDVISSTITMTQTSGSGADAVCFYRLLRDWVVGEATWNIYSTGNNWASAGGAYNNSDRDPDLTASLSNVTSAQAYDFTGEQLCQDVEDMINGTVDNYGWIICVPTVQTDGQSHVWASADNATESSRPKLTITYTTSGGETTVTAYPQIKMFE